jgi:hypothetical protein
MKKYSELLEAKIERNLTSMSPAAPGEQHFFDLHKIVSVNDKFLQPDNGIFNVVKKVKQFNREANRYGNDTDASIKKYDENVTLADRIPNAYKRKIKGRHLFDKDGVEIDTDLNSPTNMDALARFFARSTGKNKKKGTVIVKEAKTKFKVGDNVHMGLRVKGGAGFRGKVVEVREDGNIKIERPKGPLDTYYDKHYTGHKSRVTKEEELTS